MIVIKDGPEFNKIYADKAFDKWGSPVDADIRVVEDWDDFPIPKDAERYDANLPYSVDFSEYCSMIENTLWIFNNEMIKLKKDVHMTGGGINWMFQKGNVKIFDISKMQIKFIQSLLGSWDGKNYGQFVYNFIIQNKVRHFHVNLNEKQDSNVALLKNKDDFISKINKNFEMLVSKYDPQWIWNTENVTVHNSNLIKELPKVYLGKTLLSNIFDFKYYFVKCYVDSAYNLLFPSTKAFIKRVRPNATQGVPPCKKLELNVPVAEIYEEIQGIKKYLRKHRSDSEIAIGWKAFCIHGQSFDRTKEDSAYPDFLGHKWTPEALEHMPVTIKWLKSLGYKNFQRVRVMCLMPKSFINLHKDQIVSKLDPVNVAINHPTGCKFYLENHGELEFSPGVAYQLNLVNHHAVINDSNVPRYHIIIHGDK